MHASLDQMLTSTSNLVFLLYKYTLFNLIENIKIFILINFNNIINTYSIYIYIIIYPFNEMKRQLTK